MPFYKCFFVVVVYVAWSFVQDAFKVLSEKRVTTC